MTPVCRTLGLLVLSGVTGQALRLRVYSVISYFLAPGATVARRIDRYFVAHLHAAGSRGSFVPIWLALAVQYLEQSTSNNSTQWFLSQFLFPAHCGEAV